MPLQNRADPFGILHAKPARGTMMGNRGGRIHSATRTLGKKQFASRRWICCVCEFRGRQRNVWGESYTELFFLDEITALAGGHRPCFECRREEARRFAACLSSHNGKLPVADAMDLILHRQRLATRAGEYHYAPAQALPDGAMFVHEGKPFAVRNGRQLAWDFSGYSNAGTLTGTSVGVLTPGLVLEALRNGYTPRWHDSAG